MMSWSRNFAIASLFLLLTSPVWAQNPNNPIQVALLRWYAGNTATTVSTCSRPGTLAFDGVHIWTTCYGANELAEFNASDDAAVGELTAVFPGGQTLSNILFDGQNLWATGDPSSGNGEVVKINVAAANATIQSNPNHTNPPSASCAAAMCSYVTTGLGLTAFAMTFDGANVWVTNYGSNTITQIPASGTTGTSIPLTGGCTAPIGIAADTPRTLNARPNIWVGCSGSNSVLTVNGSTQTAVPGTFTGAGVITYDGTNMWVGGSGSQMYEIYPTGSTYGSISFTLSSGAAGAMAYDGKYVWVSSSPVAKLLPRTNNGVPTTPTLVGTFPSGDEPTGIAFDGANIWVANSNSNTLSKF